jgi:hypothetical protein
MPPRKRPRLIIASSNAVTTTAVSSQGGRSRIKEIITGSGKAVLGHAILTSEFAEPEKPGSTDNEFTVNHSDYKPFIQEVKETPRSKAAGIKIETKARNLNSVSTDRVFRKFY